MSESEFMELLNLYIDHEIDAADAARLEAEVMANPERRRVYRQYCQVHKACALIAERTRGEAAPDAAGRVAAFAAQPRGWRAELYAAGLLAAAGIAVVIGIRTRPAASPDLADLGRGLAGTVQAAAAAPRGVPVAAVAADREVLQPVVTLRSLTSGTADPGASRLAGAAPTGSFVNAFAWMNGVRIAPLQKIPVDATVFVPEAPFENPDAELLRAVSPSLQAPVERASFQFQR
jgi:hypothetical protein